VEEALSYPGGSMTQPCCIFQGWFSFAKEMGSSK